MAVPVVKKIHKQSSLLVGGVDLGVLLTGKKERKERVQVEQIEVKNDTSMYSRIIPNMFLDSEYVCTITETTNKKGIIEKSYDWNIASVEGVKCKYPVCHYYVDSEGDLHIIGKIDNSIVSISWTNDDNLAKELALSEISISAATTTATGTRKHIKPVSDTLTEICTLSYGDYRKLFQHKQHKGTDIDSIIYYVRQDYVNELQKTVYCGAMSCNPDNYELALFLIKDIAKAQKKTSIVYNV